jgi:hypothetical protein
MMPNPSEMDRTLPPECHIFTCPILWREIVRPKNKKTTITEESAFHFPHGGSDNCLVICQTSPSFGIMCNLTCNCNPTVLNWRSSKLILVGTISTVWTTTTPYKIVDYTMIVWLLTRNCENKSSISVMDRKSQHNTAHHRYLLVLDRRRTNQRHNGNLWSVTAILHHLFTTVLQMGTNWAKAMFDWWSSV